jgi:hypothetical protein
MSVDSNGIPVVPKRRKREVPLEEQLDAPEFATTEEPAVLGVLIAAGPSGWILMDVAIPESLVPRFTTKVREGEISAIVLGQAETQLSRIIETSDRAGAYSKTTRTGTLTPAFALEQLQEAIAELHDAYWGPAATPQEASDALRVFTSTGKLPLEWVGRKPNGDDRQRLQRLVAALRKPKEGEPLTEEYPQWPSV